MKKVIILEDESIIVSGLKKILEEVIGGFEVVAVDGTGRQVQFLVEQHQPDLVITDIRMPGVDGLEALHTLRALHKDLPVIILSGHADFAYAQEALNSGARAYLLKPLDRIELAAQLSSFFPPVEAQQADALAEPNQILREVKGLISEHLKEDLSLTALADRVSLNSQYLSRLFKERTGENLSRYILRQRAEKARQLLETTHLKVYEVAQLSGFGNVNRLNEACKEIFGKTPGQFRKL